MQAASVPVVFDEHHLSEVQNMASETKLDQVIDSMKESKVALIGEDCCWGSGTQGLSAIAAGSTGSAWALWRTRGTVPGEGAVLP